MWLICSPSTAGTSLTVLKESGPFALEISITAFLFFVPFISLPRNFKSKFPVFFIVSATRISAGVRN